MKQKLICLLIAVHIMLICVILMGREPETYETRIMNVSAYCKEECCCKQYADGKTASGHKIKPGDVFVAAPKDIPFGTEVIVPGYANGRRVPVLDRGGLIKDNRLDLYFEDKDGKTGHQRALEWGRKTMQVRVVR